MKRFAAIAVACLGLGGCATITQGDDQAVAISTPGAEGAECTLTSPAIGSVSVITPGTVTLAKSKHDIQVSCRKDCFEDAEAIIPSNFEGMTLGNILIGGVIGVGVDAASGAMNKYQSTVQITMTPKRDCTVSGS